MTYNYCRNKISFQNLIMLSASVPRFESKLKKDQDGGKVEKKQPHLFNILSGMMPDES
jgi:hypothetical protein